MIQVPTTHKHSVSSLDHFQSITASTLSRSRFEYHAEVHEQITSEIKAQSSSPKSYLIQIHLHLHQIGIVESTPKVTRVHA